MYESDLQKTEGWEDWMGNFITTEFKKVLGIETIDLYYCWDETQADIIKITSDPKDAVDTLLQYGTFLKEKDWRNTVRKNKAFQEIVKDFEEDLEERIIKSFKSNRDIVDDVDISKMQLVCDETGNIDIVFTD